MEQRPFSVRYGPLITGLAVIFALDQYTKFLVRQNFDLYESVPVIKGFFNLTYITNKGAAFGFMSGADGPWIGRFFILFSIFAIVLVIFIYREIEKDDKALKTALILILSGAVGNLADRFYAGKVTDFLDFHIGSYHWPAFNVADSCITIGVIVIIASWIYSEAVKKKTNKKEP